jgi:hypothetical protein
MHCPWVVYGLLGYIVGIMHLPHGGLRDTGRRARGDRLSIVVGRQGGSAGARGVEREGSGYLSLIVALRMVVLLISWGRGGRGDAKGGLPLSTASSALSQGGGGLTAALRASSL